MLLLLPQPLLLEADVRRPALPLQLGWAAPQLLDGASLPAGKSRTVSFAAHSRSRFSGLLVNATWAQGAPSLYVSYRQGGRERGRAGQGDWGREGGRHVRRRVQSGDAVPVKADAPVPAAAALLTGSSWGVPVAAARLLLPTHAPHACRLAERGDRSLLPDYIGKVSVHTWPGRQAQDADKTLLVKALPRGAALTHAASGLTIKVAALDRAAGIATVVVTRAPIRRPRRLPVAPPR